MNSFPVPNTPKTYISWDCVECSCRLSSGSAEIIPAHMRGEYCVLCGHDSEFHLRTLNIPTWEKGYKAAVANFVPLMNACEDLIIALTGKGVGEQELEALRKRFLNLRK